MFGSNYFAITQAGRQISESNDRVAYAMRENGRAIAESNRQVAASYDRLGDTLRENSAKEIAARDRVDIPLSEYLRMKEDIERLSSENRRLQALLGRIGFPFDLPVVPDSIRKYECLEPSLMDLTQRFMIEFKCDMADLSPAQRRFIKDEFVHR